MIKLIFGIALVLFVTVDAVGSCSANCPGCSTYVLWNQEIINNNNNSCSSYSLSTPSGFTKVKPYATSGTVSRKWLSYYTLNAISGCNVYCPPGSYLTNSSSTYFYCSRDSAYYPSSISKCIPHFEKPSGDSTYCNGISSGSLQTNLGKCNHNVFVSSSTDYQDQISNSQIDCCFDNFNDVSPISNIRDILADNGGYFNMHNVW